MKDFKILDDINEIIYVSDLETYELIYLNKKAKEVFGEPWKEMKELKCYEYFQNRNDVCDFCNNEELLKMKSYTWFRKHPKNDKHYMLYDSILDIKGKKYRMELAVDVSELEADAAKVRDSLEIEKRLEECIKKLVTIGNFDGAVNSVLNTILTYYNGDRAYIFEFDWEKHVCNNTFESCRAGIKPEIEILQNIPIDIVDIWIKLFENKSIVVIDDIDDIAGDEKRKAEYDILIMQDIRSLVTVPIFYDGKLQGFLGVDNPKNNNKDTDFLENLAFFITNEIQKNKLTSSLIWLSYSDMLTGLHNRNAYNKELDLMKNEKFKSKGVLFVDMNGLKYLNDTFGHKYGDNTIVHLANVLKKHFKEEQIFRISGDEFVILCKDMTYRDFMNQSLYLRKELLVQENGLACVGYIWDDSNTDIKLLEQQAEQLMYAHKQNYYITDINSSKKKRPKYIDKIVRILNEEEYEVYLQPIQSTKNDKIYGAEALVRKIDSQGNVVSPIEFIHILEKENSISHIDFFVFEQVCETLVKWAKENCPKYYISCNFSRITVAENGFVEHILEICDRTGVDCSRLVFEITESSKVVHLEKLSDIMNTLKVRGIRFALDDMGTEYSTLEMLTLEELDVVKFDRSLIMRLSNGNRDQFIIENLITLCHKINMICVAEGVETQEQYELLANMNCDRIQGYLIGKPMSISQFENKYFG